MDNFKKIFKINISTITFLFVLITLCTIVTVNCRPSDSQPYEDALEIAEYDNNIKPDDLEKVKKCHADEDLMELCQRCAKVTKSNIVFPMCCGDVDDAKMWCEEYVYYGIQEKK